MSKTILQNLIGAWCPSLGPSGYTLLDRSGRGTHGTLTNMDAGTDWVGSPGGWALDFDGVNDFVSYSTQIDLAGAKLVTISAWVWRATLGIMMPFVRYVNTSTLGANRRADGMLVLSDGSLYMAVQAATAGGGDYSEITSTSKIIAGQWNLITCSMLIDGASTAGQWVLNGIPVTTTVTNTGTPPTQWEANVSTAPYTSMRSISGSGTTSYWSGRLDEVAAWRRRLTTPEMQQLYQAGRGGLGRLLTPQRRSYAFRVPTAVKSYLFTNRGQVIGGGTL
jgi:Concanavalin A-like lectin/glucanases superfamily